MAVISSNKRNLVLDIMRGHFLLAILVDHLSYYTGNSLFTFYNGNGSLWVSAAEGFVFLSGFFTCFVYYPKIKKIGFKGVLLALWKRAGGLYIWSISLTIVYTIIGHAVGLAPFVGSGLQFSNVAEILPQALTLKYTYGWADILILYIPLLFLAPFIILLFKNKRAWLVASASLIMWVQNFNEIQCVRFCVSFFDLTSWQLMFVLGMLAALYKDKAKSFYDFAKRQVAIRYAVLCVFILSIYLSVADVFYSAFSAESRSTIEFLFNKETLSFGRIFLFFVWFAVTYSFINKYRNEITKYLGWLYLSFGQNSLITYIIQSALLFAFYYLPLRYSFWLNTAYYLPVILITWILVRVVSRVSKFHLSDNQQ